MANSGSPITILDVARVAGVSRQTVTRALNGLPDISAVTRQRVIDVARQLNYRPNRAAQGLVRVVVLELEGRCISYRLGLLEQGRLYDYNLAFLPQYADLGSGRVLLEEWIRWGLDDNWRWIDASRVSLENSSHQLHERMTGQLEHWRWSFYSWRPSGIALGLALRVWQWVKPLLQRYKARRAAKAAKPVAAPAPVVAPASKQANLKKESAMESEHASPSHSQR